MDISPPRFCSEWWVVISTWICISLSQTPHTVGHVLNLDNIVTSELWKELVGEYSCLDLVQLSCPFYSPCNPGNRCSHDNKDPVTSRDDESDAPILNGH